MLARLVEDCDPCFFEELCGYEAFPNLDFLTELLFSRQYQSYLLELKGLFWSTPIFLFVVETAEKFLKVTLVFTFLLFGLSLSIDDVTLGFCSSLFDFLSMSFAVFYCFSTLMSLLFPESLIEAD